MRDGTILAPARPEKPPWEVDTCLSVQAASPGSLLGATILVSAAAGYEAWVVSRAPF